MDQNKVERVCQLLPLQHGVFFEALRLQGTVKMIYQAVLDLRGTLRPEIMAEAWREVLGRHPALRTSFHYERLDVPVQVTRAHVELPWTELDWSDLEESSRPKRLREFLAADERQPFELTRAPMFRVTLIRLEHQAYWLIWTLHPLVVDGWSFYNVLGDVIRCYRELAAGRAAAAPRPRPYWEYVAWLRERDQGDADQFWRSQLAGLAGPTTLGAERVPPGAPPQTHPELPVAIDQQVGDGLEALARRAHVTVATIVHAAWAIALGRFTASDDVVFGGIVSGRDPRFEGADDLVGLFINNLPVRARLEPHAEMSQWLAGFHRQLARAHDYAHVPLSLAQQCSGLPRDVPLFECIVDFTNYPVLEDWADAGELRVADLRLLESSPYPLGLVGVGGQPGWQLAVSYDPARFTQSTMTRLAELVSGVFAAMAGQRDALLGDMPQWSTPRLGPDSQDRYDSIYDLLIGAAGAGRDRPAVLAGGESLTYGELMLAARILARRLREAGADRRTIAAVRYSPAASTVIAILGAVLAGAPFLMLTDSEPVPPSVRIMIETRPDAVAAGSAGPPGEGPVVVLAEERERAGHPSGAVSWRPAETDVFCCVTHGGRADGAWLRHCDITDAVRAMQQVMPLLPDDQVLACGSSPALVRDLMQALAAGSTVVLGDGADVGQVSVAYLRPADIGGLAPPDRRDRLRRVVCVPGPAPAGSRSRFAGAAAELVEEYPADLAGSLFTCATWAAPGKCPALARQEPPGPLAGDPDEPALAEPAGPVLEALAAAWSEALELADPVLTESSNFFDLGGHSLTAIRLVSKVRAAFGVDFTIGQLFAGPTMGSCAQVISGLLAADGQDAAPPPIPLAPAGLPVVASFAQERMWFIDQLDTSAVANNLTLSARFSLDLDAGAMRAALGTVISRHAVLRTMLREQEGVVVQLVRPDVTTPLSFDDLSLLPPDQAEARARELLAADAARRFDLGTDLPIRGRVIRLGARDCVLGICVHHAAYDGWSVDLLTSELVQAYAAEVHGTVASLPELPVQYADYSHWQRERYSAAGLGAGLVEFWRDQLAGLPQSMRLTPAAPRADAERPGSAGAVETTLPKELHGDLRRLAASEAATPFMVLLAAFGLLVARHVGHDDIVVGTPVDDRDHRDLESLIGMFVNTSVLRLPMGAGPTFRLLLAEVRRVCLDALSHRGLPFGQLVGMISPDRGTDRMPVVQLSFVVQGQPGQPMTIDGCTGTEFPVDHEVARFELTAELYPAADSMTCVFHYAKDVYERDFVGRLLREYVDLLQLVVTEPDRALARQPAGVLASDGHRKHQDESKARLRALTAQWHSTQKTGLSRP